MTTTRRKSDVRIFGFTRRHVAPRLGDVLFHRNVVASLLVAGTLTFVSFRLGWFPAFQKIAAKDLVAGILAFSALGFGAATAATVLALSMPRSRLYLTMIMNGMGAPRAKVVLSDGQEKVEPVDKPLLDRERYLHGFRSLYSDLIFVFLWTMGAQLFMGVASLIYFGIAGDLNVVDCTHCRRASAGFFIMTSSIMYAVMQLASLIKALADYATKQEVFDRAGLLPK